MDVFLIIKVFSILFLGIWSLIEVINLIKDHEYTMKLISSITLVHAEGTKLNSRRVDNKLLNVSCVFIIIILNILTVSFSTLSIFHITQGNHAQFVNLANCAILTFLIMSYTLSIFGTWFGYYIDKNQLVNIHFSLILIGLSLAITINI
tara:strand:+ start:13264 stop:13710 length:447 start_codon:yes stop_codon:yes gene_type:complete